MDATLLTFNLSSRKKFMRSNLFILAMAMFCISCKKDRTTAGQVVEIYLLKTYQAVAGKCQVDASASTLQDMPVIKNEDILEYSKNNYQFSLTSAAIQKIKTFMDRTPFAVTVDKQVIYFGIFKPIISSSSCENSITMDIDGASNDKIYLRLGYPGTIQSGSIDDQRNNPKLIVTLKKQGKLK